VENSSPSATSQRSQTLFPRNAFNPWLTIAVLFGAIAIVFGIETIGGMYALLRGFNTPAALRTFLTGLPGVQLQGVAEALGVVYLLALLPVLAKVPLRTLGFRALTLRDGLYVVAGAAAMIVVTNGLASLLETSLHTKVNEQAVGIYLAMKTPLAKAEFALFGIAIAAVAEETLFRLVIFNAVRKWSGFWVGAVVSGVLFGLAHWQPGSAAQSAALMIPLALGGIILSAVYYKSGNAYVPMLTHGLFNAVSLVVLFFAPQLAK